MRKSIIMVITLVVVFLFVVSCTPQITDEELEAELAKLTPEQREALLKDIESKEKGGALAGQAVSVKYGVSPKVVSVPASQIKQVVRKLENKNKFGEASGSDILLTKSLCADTDQQNNAMVLGKVTVNVSLDSFDKAVEFKDFCTDFDVNTHREKSVIQYSCSPLAGYVVIEGNVALAAGEPTYNGSCSIQISPPDDTFLNTYISASTCKKREVFVKNLPSTSTNCEQLLGEGSYCQEGICVQQFSDLG